MSDNNGDGNPNPIDCKMFGHEIPDGFKCQNYCMVAEKCAATCAALDLGEIQSGSEWDGWSLTRIYDHLIDKGTMSGAARDIVKAIRENREWALAEGYGKPLPVPDAPVRPMVARQKRAVFFADDGKDGSDEYYAFNGRQLEKAA